MKKIEYKAPEMELIKLKAYEALLTVSGPGDGSADIPVDDD